MKPPSAIGKVGVLSHVLPPSPSGQAVVLHRLLGGMAANRYCLISREGRADHAEANGAARLEGRHHTLAPVRRLNIGARFPLLSASADAALAITQRARQIVQIAREEKCTVLIGCSGDLYDLPAACLASRWAELPFVAYLFDDYVYQWTGASRSIAKRLEPLIFRWSRGAIVPNEFLRAEVAKRHGPRCIVVRNPCPLPDLELLDRAPRVLPDGSVDIVYAGAVYHANQDAFVSLLAAVRKLERADVRVHLFTAQSAPELRRLGIAGPAVIHHPHIPSAEVPAVLRQASLLYLPLGFDTPISEVIRTSAPGKTGEYLSVARPILVHAPRDSFVSWYFRENRCGVVVERSDQDQLAAALEQLLSDSTLRRDLGARARLAAERDFDVGPVRARFEEAIWRVSAGKSLDA